MEAGTGKTVVAIKWIEFLFEKKDQRVLIFAPPIVCQQWVSEFKKFSNLRAVSATGSSKKKLEAFGQSNILVTNYEAVRSKDVLNEIYKFAPTVLVCDECFHPDTLVTTRYGDKKIKDIIIGDEVLNCLGWRKVTKTFSKSVDTSYKIWFNNREIIVSANHLFFTENGWVKTKDLKKGDLLVRTNQTMSILRGNFYKNCISINKKMLQNLFSQLWNEIKSENERVSKLYTKSKSNVFGQNTKKNDSNFKENKTQTPYSSWKWFWPNYPRTKNIRKIWEEICSQFYSSIGGYKKLSYSLQNRFRLSGINVGNRSGWSQSSIAYKAETGQKERQEIDFIRVENIEVQKSTSDERNPKGLFYDLEVDGHPSFTINEVLVHNSHRVKSPSAKQSKEIAKLSKYAMYRLNMTGTPMTNSELDLFQQFLVLDGGATFGQNFYTFRAKYFEDKNAHRRGAHNYFPDWQIKDSAREEIARILSKRAFVARKSECLELPDMVYKTIEVELSADQKKSYIEMKKDFLTFVKDARGDVHSSAGRLAITKALRLQQIVSGFISTEDENEICFSNNPRMDALKELLLDLPSPVIVWASFRQNYKAIEKVCIDLGLRYGFLVGGQSEAHRRQTLDDFREKKLDVMIANQGAGGIGVNLVEASNAIYYSRDFSLEKDIQSEARNYRGGSEIHEKVTRYDLVAKDTIDVDILSALKNKKNVLEFLLKGNQ